MSKKNMAGTTVAFNLTVAICTYNRADSLKHTLQTLCDATYSFEHSWELLVIDNNSTDHTVQVIQGYSGKLPLRYVFEARQGLSSARNRAIEEARSPFLVFTDDDVDVQPGWLEAYRDLLQRYPKLAFAGGKILPAWESPPPAWVTQFARRWLEGILVYCDLGEKEHVFHPVKDYFYGANMGFNVGILQNLGGFDIALGRQGRELIGGEELAVIDLLAQRNYLGVYSPRAVIHHRIARERWGRLFIFRNSIGHGKTCGIMRESLPNKWIGNIPLRLTLNIVKAFFEYGRGELTRKPDKWLPGLCLLGQAIGEWQEIRNIRKRQRH